MSYIPEYHENYYRVEGTAYNQGKIGIGTINPVQLLHVSGGNFRLDGTGYVNGDLNVTGNLNVYGSTAQFAVSQVIAEDKSIELNVATGTPIGGGNYTAIAFSNDAGADEGGFIVKSTQGDKVILYETTSPASGWVSNQRWNVSGNYGKNTLNLTDTTADVGMTIGTDTVLFRSGANVLSTDDRFGITYDGGKNTLHLNNTAVNVGITIAHDTNLYRSGVGVLQTDSLLSTTANSGKNTLHLNNTATNVGMTIAHDTNLYRSAANTLTTDDNFSSTYNGGKTTLALTDTTANVGMTIGADTNLYRSAANTLKTDDNLIVDIDLSINGNTTLGDATSDTVAFNARANTDLLPSTPNSRNLGSSALPWSNVFTNTLQVAANSTLTGNLNVNGNTNLGDAYADQILITGKFLRGIATYSGAGVTTQASSTTIASDKVIVTGAGVANGALTLPAAIAGMEVEIRNRFNLGISVYANPGGDRIFDSGFLIANANPIVLNSGNNRNFLCAPSGGINIWF